MFCSDAKILEALGSLEEEVKALRKELFDGGLPSFAAQRKAAVRALYEGRSISQLAHMCGMPDGFLMDRDGLPHQLDQERNDQLTFWVSLTGELYHVTRCCHPSALYPCNAVNLSDRRPCPRCNPKVPDLQWYDRYKDVVQQLQFFGLSAPPRSWHQDQARDKEAIKGGRVVPRAGHKDSVRYSVVGDPPVDEGAWPFDLGCGPTDEGEH